MRFLDEHQSHFDKIRQQVLVKHGLVTEPVVAEKEKASSGEKEKASTSEPEKSAAKRAPAPSKG
jgi:hypothetical protein